MVPSSNPYNRIWKRFANVVNVFVLSFLTLAIACSELSGQSSELLNGNDAYHIIDRLEILGGKENPSNITTSLKPYNRKDLTQFAIRSEIGNPNLSSRDIKDIQYIYKDNNDWIGPIDDAEAAIYSVNRNYEKVFVDSAQLFYTYQPANKNSDGQEWQKRYFESKKPWFNLFYKTPANFWEIDRPAFKMRVNPLFHFKMGKESSLSGVTFLNTRGFDLRGSIDNRVWFHTSLYENQARFPTHITDRNKATTSVPGAGFYKTYNSKLFDITDGYDYLTAQGYVVTNISKHIHIQLGHGKQYIGNGYRSLFLSDYSTNQFYLKLNTKVWKFEYQNIFAELTSQFRADTLGDITRPKKYMAIHYLAFNILPNLSIGFFESVVFDRGTTFELQYLNPVIFYRTIEQATGSPDNAMLGIDVKYNFLKRFSVYGQLLLDEFVFDELLIERRGWWANKIGYQIGFKYINVFGIDHLDFQFEYNSVRPYTYTHRDETANFTHYNQPLAHNLGANFREGIFILRYQPIYKLKLRGRLLFANYGTDTADSNWGGDIFLFSDMRSAPDGVDPDFGHAIGQGVGNKLMIANLTAEYQILHNLYVDLDFTIRNQTSDAPSRDYNRTLFSVGFRLNIADNVVDY